VTLFRAVEEKNEVEEGALDEVNSEGEKPVREDLWGGCRKGSRLSSGGTTANRGVWCPPTGTVSSKVNHTQHLSPHYTICTGLGIENRRDKGA